jgi:acyl-coenzyme A thioesterase PaaI-like protein
MMLSLFQGYRPQFKYHTLGREVEALMHLKPHQRMCYYEGKLFGGYIAFLIDRILADCCERKPAYTASLNTSFLLAIPPDVPIMLRAWPVKVDGRKTFLEGSVQIPGKTTGEWVNAIKAEALFIEPKP